MLYFQYESQNCSYHVKEKNEDGVNVVITETDANFVFIHRDTVDWFFRGHVYAKSIEESLGVIFVIKDMYAHRNSKGAKKGFLLGHKDDDRKITIPYKDIETLNIMAETVEHFITKSDE